MFRGFSSIRKFCSPVIKPLTIKNILKLEPCNQEISVIGWLKNYRKYKLKSFWDIDDGSCIKRIQVVVPKDVISSNPTYHACVYIEGKLVKSNGAHQNAEVVADKVKIMSPGAPHEYPFAEKTVFLEQDIRHLPHMRSRTRHFSSMLRVRSQAKVGIRKYFDSEGFLGVETPILTSTDCEGDGEGFVVKGQGSMNAHDAVDRDVGNYVFGKDVFLTVSAQLHLEALANGLSRVYCINPTFRSAGESNLHLHEFWMAEAEEAFLEGREGYDALMDRLEELTKAVLRHTLDQSQEDINFLWDYHNSETKSNINEIVNKAANCRYERITLAQARRILADIAPKSLPKEGLNRASEVAITGHYGNVPVFITDWPAQEKPFYMATDLDQQGEKVALAVDLLLPNLGEVAGGGLREANYNDLRGRLPPRQSENLEWYADLRQFGYAPTGGFGLGVERLLQFILGIKNIRDVITFARANGRCHC